MERENPLAWNTHLSRPLFVDGGGALHRFAPVYAPLCKSVWNRTGDDNSGFGGSAVQESPSSFVPSLKQGLYMQPCCVRGQVWTPRSSDHAVNVPMLPCFTSSDVLQSPSELVSFARVCNLPSRISTFGSFSAQITVLAASTTCAARATGTSPFSQLGSMGTKHPRRGAATRPLWTASWVCDDR